MILNLPHSGFQWQMKVLSRFVEIPKPKNGIQYSNPWWVCKCYHGWYKVGPYQVCNVLITPLIGCELTLGKPIYNTIRP